jgi:hypothetical protein
MANETPRDPSPFAHLPKRHHNARLPELSPPRIRNSLLALSGSRSLPATHGRAKPVKIVRSIIPPAAPKVRKAELGWDETLGPLAGHFHLAKRAKPALQMNAPRAVETIGRSISPEPAFK